VGCGAGLAGLALHRAGARLAVLADGDERAVVSCARNMALNGAAGVIAAADLAAAAAVGGRQGGAEGAAQAAVACCRLLWEEAAPPEEGERAGPDLPAFDVVVASDVLYDPSCVGAFVRLLSRLLRAGGGGGSGSVAYIATTLRNPATLRLFEDLAGAAGLELERLDAGPWAVAFQHAHALRDRGGEATTILLHRVTASGHL
jgi:hypothetical protein